MTATTNAIRLLPPARAEATGRAAHFPWVCGVGLGLLGFASNFAAIDVAFGLDFIMGGTLAVIALRLFGLGPGIAAGVIAGATTYFLWHHPYAAIVFTCEIAFIGVLERWRNVPSTLAAAIYWIVIGTPLLVATYGGIMGMDAVSLGLVITKQAINGLIQVILAEAAILGLLLMAPRFGRALGQTGVGLRNLMFVALVGFTAVPVMVLGTLEARNQFDKVIGNTSMKAIGLLDQAGALLRNEFVTVERAIMASVGNDADLRAAMRVHDIAMLRLRVQGEGTRELMGDISPVLPVLPTLDNLAAVGDNGRPARLDVRQSLARLNGLLAEMALPKGGEVAIHAAPPPAAAGKKIDLDDGLSLLLPTMPGKSIMLVWSAARVEAARPLGASGAWLQAFVPLQEAVLDYRSSLLRQLIAALAVLLVVPVIALPVSRHVSTGLAGITDAMRQFASVGFAGSPGSLQRSGIVELASVGKEFDRLVAELASKRTQARLYQQRLERVISDAPAVIFVAPYVDDVISGHASYISPSAERIIGYTPEEMNTPGWFADNLHPDDRDRIAESDRNLREKGKTTHHFRFRHKQGHYLTIYNETQVILDTEAATREVIGLWIDQTKQHEVERKLIQSAKLVDIGQMATGMAHELNQPLNIIDLAAANLAGRLERGKADGDYVRAKLDRIRQQVSRASEIIDHMRIFGRSDPEERRPFKVARVLEAIDKMYRKQIQFDGIEFVVVDDLPGAEVVGSEGQLEQVLLNLIINARYQIRMRINRGETSPGGGRHRIRISLAGDGGDRNVRIVATDTGGGIDPAVLPRIFEPFVTTKPVGQGTGLGLSITYGIIHDMGGEFEAVNEGEGACFIITLPFAAKVAA